MSLETQEVSFLQVNQPSEYVAPESDHPSDADTDIEVLRTIPERFEVTDAQSANWLIRKIKNAREYVDQVRVWADREAARGAREEQVLMYLFGNQLRRFAQEEVAKLGGRRKSIPLPAGTLAFRSVPARLVVDDEQAVLQWARKHLPTAVVQIERLAKALVLDHAAKEGEIPDEGVHFEPATEKFSIR